MQKTNARFNDVKPSQLKKHDRIHTSAGMFEVVNTDVIDKQVKIVMRPMFSPSKKKAHLVVHKSTRFSMIRPYKK